MREARGHRPLLGGEAPRGQNLGGERGTGENEWEEVAKKVMWGALGSLGAASEQRRVSKCPPALVRHGDATSGESCRSGFPDYGVGELGVAEAVRVEVELPHDVHTKPRLRLGDR